MTLGGAISAALPLLRAQAESMMTDTCTITRPGEPVFDSTTGTYTDAGTTVYTGKCRIRTRSIGFLRDRQAEAGEELTTIWPYIVAVPISASDVKVLDVVTVDTCADPLLVGVTLRVRIANAGTNANARKLDCEEVAS
ncbi:MAG TPA: DUF6093 family protein [Nocardioides sp.]|nr:DUF6093 family protein [Nocardioides sp.]